MRRIIFLYLLTSMACLILSVQSTWAAPPSADKAREGGDIEGIISLCAGSPEGLTVYIPSTSFDARTGTAGAFRLSYVQPGTYTLIVRRGTTRLGSQSNVVVAKTQTTDLGTWAICLDADGDGYAEDLDCDDSNSAVNPGASEVCGDGIDNNCDGSVDEDCQTCTDGDSDGYYAQAGCGTEVDCNDANSLINPGATEVCDGGIDNDCDFYADDLDLEGAEGKQLFYGDFDSDGYGTTAYTAESCSLPEGYAEVGGDCDDADDTVYPGAEELCDGLDNDCDGSYDEDIVYEPVECTMLEWNSPVGICEIVEVIPYCQDGVVVDSDDLCGHEQPPLQYYPDENGTPCDGVDNDCDGEVDEYCVPLP